MEQVRTGPLSWDTPDLDCILCMADLQGRVIAGSQSVLLGEALAEEIELLSLVGDIPPLDRTLCILAGDFWGDMTRRGGYGDVRPVWEALAGRCGHVVGIAGNHDLFGDEEQDQASPHRFISRSNIRFLDGDATNVHGLSIAGISGVIGNPRRPYRRQEEDYLDLMRDLLAQAPDIFVMHEAPSHPDVSAPGRRPVMDVLDDCASQSLVVFGHVQWTPPLHQLRNGMQILSVDERVVVLERL